MEKSPRRRGLSMWFDPGGTTGGKFRNPEGESGKESAGEDTRSYVAAM